MSTLVLEHEPLATGIDFTADTLVVALADGRSLSVPLDWYPRLLHATARERGDWQLLGDGYGIEWPELDEHIGIDGLLAGRRSGESEASFKRWLQARLATRPTSQAT